MKSRKRISKINSSVFIIVGTEQSDKSATLKRKQMSWAGGDLVHKMTAVGGLILELYTHIKARPSGWQDLNRIPGECWSGSFGESRRLRLLRRPIMAQNIG